MTKPESLVDRINPISVNKLVDSLDRLVSSGFYSKEQKKDLEEAITQSSYWNQHLAVHIFISAGTGVDPSGITSLATSSPLKTGYSIAMFGLELTRKQYKKALTHLVLSIPAFIPKFGAFVYLIPVLVNKPELAPVYLHSILSYVRDFFVDKEFQELQAQKDSLLLTYNFVEMKGGRENWTRFEERKASLMDQANQLSKKYVLRVFGEALACTGLMAVQSLTELPIPDYAYKIGLIGTGLFCLRDTARYFRIGHLQNYVERLS